MTPHISCRPLPAGGCRVGAASLSTSVASGLASGSAGACCGFGASFFGASFFGASFLGASCCGFPPEVGFDACPCTALSSLLPALLQPVLDMGFTFGSSAT